MSDRGAVLQIEIDRNRWDSIAGRDYSANTCGEQPHERIYHLAKTAAADTIRNGGTFVLVVTAEKITMVQRPDAEDLDASSQ